MTTAFTPDQIQYLHQLIDVRMKALRHENDDHLDRALLPIKIVPSTTSGDVLATQGDDAEWVSIDEIFEGEILTTVEQGDAGSSAWLVRLSEAAELYGATPDRPLYVTTADRQSSVEVRGSVTALPPAATAAPTWSVTSTTSEQVISPANASRVGMSIYNNSTSSLYLKTGPGVSSSLFTVLIPAAFVWEMPWAWRGPLYGVWASANGNAMVTEFTI